MTEPTNKRPPFIIARTKTTVLVRSVITGKFIAFHGPTGSFKCIATDKSLLRLFEKMQQRAPEHFHEFMDRFQRRMSGKNHVQYIVAANNFPLELPQ